MAKRNTEQTEGNVEVDDSGVDPAGQPVASNDSPAVAGDDVPVVEQGEVAKGYTGRTQIVLVGRGAYISEYGTFVLDEPQSVNTEARDALLAVTDNHGMPLFKQV